MASLVIYENGTLSGTNGSACSSGDFSQPLGPITTLNTTGSAVVRVDASTHYCASGGLTLVGSSGLEFSWDESTWSASLTNSSADVSYVNKMLYFRQTTNATGASGHFTSSADLSTTTQLADVTGLTASATASGGAYYVTWSWTAVSNASYYLIEYGAGTAYNTSAITSASSYTASGLSAGTEYGAQVKADGSGRYIDSANYVTASATPSNDTILNYTFTQSDGAFSDAGSTACYGGTAFSSITRNVASGILEMQGTSNAAYAMFGLRNSTGVTKPTGTEQVVFQADTAPTNSPSQPVPMLYIGQAADWSDSAAGEHMVGTKSSVRLFALNSTLYLQINNSAGSTTTNVNTAIDAAGLGTLKTLKVIVKASTIEVEYNGSGVWTGKAHDFASALYFGWFTYSTVNSGTIKTQWDNLSITTLDS